MSLQALYCMEKDMHKNASEIHLCPRELAFPQVA